MSTHNIHVHGKIRKFPQKVYLNICSVRLPETFSRDSKTNSN